MRILAALPVLFSLAPATYGVDICFGPARVVGDSRGREPSVRNSPHVVELVDNGLRIPLIATIRGGYWDVSARVGTIVDIWGESKRLPLWPSRSETTDIASTNTLIVSIPAPGNPVCFIRSEQQGPANSRYSRNPDPWVPRKAIVDSGPCTVRIPLAVLENGYERTRGEFPSSARFSLVLWNRNLTAGRLRGGQLQALDPGRVSAIRVPCGGVPDDVVVFWQESVTKLNLDIAAYAAAHTVSADEELRTATRRAMTRRVEGRRIELTADAKAEIERQVAAQAAVILRLSAAQRGVLSDELLLSSALVEHYLYDLSDQQDGQILGRLRVPEWRKIALLEQDTSSTAKVISRADVSKYTFASLLTKFFPGGTPTRLARLEVKSTPVGGRIRIDNLIKGYTNRRFVMSVGSHVIEIQAPGSTVQCSEGIQLADGDDVTFTCPVR